MATILIGSKSHIFYLNQTTWRSRTDLSSDVLIQVNDFSFFLHKFPLVNASPVLRNLVTKYSSEEHNLCNFALHKIPGGPQSFELVAKFCYGEKFELTSSNAVPLLCSAYYLDMNEDHMTRNLISQAEDFLSKRVLSNWEESVTALLSCEHVLNSDKKLDIVSRCLDSLSCKVMIGKLSYPPQRKITKGIDNADGVLLVPKVSRSNWWHDDASSLSLPLFKRLIALLGAKGHDPTNISSAVIYYWNKVNSNSTSRCLDDLRLLLEETVALLPVQNRVTPTKTLFSMLSASLMYSASATCIESLETRIGAQLHKATLENLLVPNLRGPRESKHASSKKNESKYDIDCIQRIIEQFVKENLHESETTMKLEDEYYPTEDYFEGLAKVEAVAKLVDEYLLKIASDANLNFQQFESLASAIPASARALNDVLYHAIDVYVQCHPSLLEQEKEQLFLIVDVSKLSRELCQEIRLNEKLPVKVMVKMLANEVLHLKISLDGTRTGTLVETKKRTENSTSIIGKSTLVWQRLKLHNYDILKKKLKNRVDKAKVVKRNWKFILGKKMRSIGVGKALPGPSSSGQSLK